MSRTANPTPTFFHGLPAYLGGKRRFCPLLFTLLAEHLPRAVWQTSRFLDPFSGGGAVSLYAKAQSFGWTIANNYSFYSTSGVWMDTSSGESLRITITGSAVGGTPPSPTPSVAAAESNEGDDIAFTVTLSEAAAADVTATWTASIESGDTAQAEDLGSTTGTVTVTASQTTATFTVPTTDDTTDEPDETFTLTLSSPSNATLAADPTATGTITDDDRGICNSAPRIRDRILVLLKYRPMFVKRLNGDRVREGEF